VVLVRYGPNVWPTLTRACSADAWSFLPTVFTVSITACLQLALLPHAAPAAPRADMVASAMSARSRFVVLLLTRAFISDTEGMLLAFVVLAERSVVFVVLAERLVAFEVPAEVDVFVRAMGYPLQARKKSAARTTWLVP
jgi:hypothetical protein